ncbi:lipopolysaccharide biosynthesis protein [Methanosarcina sp.]|uniref:lipopolysaccharide biosynthesis protein n=1 Tax=Methanosarcina sp. TaxID=2213 RepID=UPI003BB5259E
MNLKSKAVYSAAFIALSVMIQRTLTFVTKIVLARLLAPADFGLIAVALLTVNSIALFRDFGIGATLIYKDDDSEYTAANTALVLLPVIAGILLILAYISAPFVADFFKNSFVKPIVRVLAFTLLINSFSTVPSQLLDKELEFKKKVLPETVPKVAYGIISITLAWIGFGVWSIVYGEIALSLLSVVLVWAVSDWRPTFRFNIKAAYDLLDYGKYILGTTILMFFITNIDNAIVARMLGTEVLGIYTMAYAISTLLATQTTFMIDKVMFPTYIKLQGDRDAVKRAYIKTLKYVSMVSIPATVGIFAIAPDFVSVVLGDKWTSAVIPIQILSIFGLSKSIAASNGSLRNSLGRPDIEVKLTLLQIMIFLIIFYPLTIYKGIIGMCIAVLVSALITHISSFIINQQLFDIKIIDVVKAIYIYFLNALLMLLILYVNHSFIQQISQFSRLILLIAIGFIAYVFLCYFTSKSTIIELLQIVRVEKE